MNDPKNIVVQQASRSHWFFLRNSRSQYRSVPLGDVKLFLPEHFSTRVPDNVHSVRVVLSYYGNHATGCLSSKENAVYALLPKGETLSARMRTAGIGLIRVFYHSSLCCINMGQIKFLAASGDVHTRIRF